MLKKTFIFLLCLSLHSVVAQVSRFPKLWQNATEYLSNPHATPMYYYSNYYLTNDSVTSGDTVYFKFYYSDDKIFNIGNLSPFGFLAEIDNRLYHKNVNNAVRVVLDFNLTVGDSFLFNATVPFYLKVLNVDSALYNNVLKKRITFEKIKSLNVVWVEDFGDIEFGLHFSSYQAQIQATIFQWLNCYSEDSIVLFGTCRLPVSASPLTYHSLKLYPQPAQNELFVSDLPQGKKTLLLFDLLGKVLWHKESWLESEKIDLTDLPKGMYILEVQTESNRFTEKVLKE